MMRLTSDIFKKVGALDNDSQSSVVRMAAAISTDTVSAASAFAAASTIAAHNHTFTNSVSISADEEVLLMSELKAAKDVKTLDQLVKYVKSHDVGRFVTAARVLSGRGRASALTTLANFAVLMPDLRETILLSDCGSITESISRMILSLSTVWYLRSVQ